MKRNIVAIVASMSLMGAAPAWGAVSPTCSGYNPDCTSISSATSSSTSHKPTSPPESTTTSATPAAPTTTTSSANTGELPFTGLDIGLLLAGGGSLAGLGFIIRRTSKRTI